MGIRGAGPVDDGGGRVDRTRLIAAVAAGVIVLGVFAFAFIKSRGDDAAPPDTVPVLKPILVGERVSRLVTDAGVVVPEGAQRDCALAELDRNTELVDALGENPKASARFGDLEAIAERCRFQASSDDRITTTLQAKANGSLSDTQLACVRTAVSQYKAEERTQVVEAGLVDVAPGPLRDRVRELLSICGVDAGSVGFT